MNRERNATVLFATKAVALLYTLAAPSFLGSVEADLTAVYGVGFVAAASAWLVDPTLSVILIAAVLVTMMTINRASPVTGGRRDVAPWSEPDPDLDPAATMLPAPISLPDTGHRAGPEVVTSRPGPDHATDAQDQPPEVADGPTFLLDASGQFGHVTPQGLASAQDNRVGAGGDTVICPLGGGSYTAQGTASGAGVVPMVWG